MLKKIISFLIVLLVLFSSLLLPASAQYKTLKFNEDGNFRILQINDFQDTDTTNADSISFLNAVLDKYKPDLVVIVGDQLSDRFPNVSAEKIKIALSNQLSPIEERGIPFLFTFGNHDRDYESIMSMEEQAAFYREFSSCYANTQGADGGTYNTVIYGKDGITPCLNIYMMDTQHWNGTGWTSGVTEDQVNWYIRTSNNLKEMNGGAVVPSLVFQHIPVKEIMKLTKVVPAETQGAVKNLFNSEYIVLDEEADWIGDRNVMREAPGCENPEKITGQYEAWLSQGDIIGAYFGHEHINTFVGRTEDGIVLGYNGGFGFATYGDPDERYARIYDFNETDVENYTQQTIYYSQCVIQEDPEEEPSVPAAPVDPSNNCTCNCHKEGFMGFIWKILRFFYKFFGTNRICDCGISHY